MYRQCTGNVQAMLKGSSNSSGRPERQFSQQHWGWGCRGCANRCSFNFHFTVLIFSVTCLDSAFITCPRCESLSATHSKPMVWQRLGVGRSSLFFLKIRWLSFWLQQVKRAAWVCQMFRLQSCVCDILYRMSSSKQASIQASKQASEQASKPTNTETNEQTNT